MRLQAAVALPGRHGAPQLIGLARRVVGGDYRQLHDLLLEQRNPQGALEDDLEFRGGIDDRLLAIAAAQVGMNHVPLDRPGADDGDLDHQVVESLRPQARQHRHLRTRFDLEHAYGVGAADHRVGGEVFRRQGRQGPALTPMTLDQVEAAPQCTEHAEGEDVDLEQADQVEVVLVPLDDGAPGHGRVLHRHQGIQRLLGDDEAARVL
ncbi:hypothetical protein D3C85_601570 [compost metagenome]